MHSRHIRFLLWPVPQLPLRGLSLDGNLRDEQDEYAENVYMYHLINAATALANASRKEVGSGQAAMQDISVGFGVIRPRLNVVCTEAPGVVVYTDPAMDDEGDMDSVLDGNYGAKTLDHNERIHYGDLKDRYRQCRDRTHQLVAQLSTLNTRNNLNPTEVRLLAKTLSKEDIRKYSKFEMLATTICDQQDALEAMRRRYDIIVHGQDNSDLLVNLRQVFERCRQYRIAFNPKKGKIGLDRIDWVGHQLDADGIHFSAEQLSKVAEFPTPVGAKGLRSSFMGLAYYFRDHVRHYADMERPIRDVLTKHDKSKKFQ